MKPTKVHRIGLYIRVSTEEQAVNPEGSIRNQEERLRMQVKVKNMESHFGEIHEVFIDRARSGKDTNRPELQRLLTAIRKREINLVMATELSRISRSIKDFSQIWEMMQQFDCGFQSLRENFDTTTAAGEMVLFTVANIAQFERRQVSERVSANFNARAQRGLFNGGSIPVGYKLIEGKSGYLAVDEEVAPAIKMAFKAFIQEGSLLPAVRWLNEQGYRLTREREGGGANRTRMGYFTVGNLKAMIKNRSYIGIKTYAHMGEKKEADAVWPPIIDRETFDRANTIMTKNFRRKKDNMADRYPYLLVGLISCKTCGDRMVGKSAHGRKEKIGYYEHSWATIKGSAIPGLKHQCAPYRVLAKQLEPAIWREIQKVLENKTIAQELIELAKKNHFLNRDSKEVEKCNQTIFSVDRQLEVLAERLATLPQAISPTPVYKQMEKLEGHKKAAIERLAQLRESGVIRDEPAELKDFEKFVEVLRQILATSDSNETRKKIIQALVRKVLIVPEGFELFFKAGDSQIKVFLGDWQNTGSLETGQTLAGRRQSSSPEDLSDLSTDASRYLQKKRGLSGSNTCQSGARERT